MSTIGALVINLNASTAAFVTELNRVKNLSFDTAAQVQRSFSLIGTAALGMASVAAGAFAIGIQKTAEWEVHILHLAESAGTSVEAMSGLSYAAKMMDLDIDRVATALERFDKQVLAMQAGNQKAAQNLSLLGIDPAQIKTSDDALMQLADHFAKLPDGAVKSGEAMMAFGKAGAQMIPLLNLGSQGIKDFLAQAAAMGVVISKDQAEQAERFEQNVTRMKESLHGLWVEITNNTLPVLNDLAAKVQDTSKQKGFWTSAMELADAINSQVTGVAPGALKAYAAQGDLLVAAQEKMRKSVTDTTLAFAEKQKAQDALKKSVESIVTTYQTSIATMGMTNLQTTEYKLRVDAAKLGLSGWLETELKIVDALNTKKVWLERLAVLDNSKIDEEKKNFLADKLALDLADADVMKKQLDLVMQMSFAPVSTFTPAPQATQAFTDSITQQTATLEHNIATFGMSAEAIARYDLAQLDASAAAQQLIAQMKVQQDQLAAMENHAKTTAAAWKTFGEVANRSLDDLIFSGKSFAQVLSDITKNLGEMFLKWALFGFGDKNTGAGGGIFGGLMSLFTRGTGVGGFQLADLPAISGVFPAFASGGDVAAGQTIMVGENGPEIFTPSTAGAITPNGGGAGPAINIVYQIDARGSSITEAQFQRSLAASETRAVLRALNMTREMQLRTA